MSEKQYTLLDAAASVGYPGPMKKNDVRRNPSSFAHELHEEAFPEEATETRLQNIKLEGYRRREAKRSISRKRLLAGVVGSAVTIGAGLAVDARFDDDRVMQTGNPNAETGDPQKGGPAPGSAEAGQDTANKGGEPALGAPSETVIRVDELPQAK